MAVQRILPPQFSVAPYAAPSMPTRLELIGVLSNKRHGSDCPDVNAYRNAQGMGTSGEKNKIVGKKSSSGGFHCFNPRCGKVLGKCGLMFCERQSSPISIIPIPTNYISNRYEGLSKGSFSRIQEKSTLKWVKG
eukprot:scaffold5391_cov171-Amphora_coffeaeformis.AAC.3